VSGYVRLWTIPPMVTINNGTKCIQRKEKKMGKNHLSLLLIVALVAMIFNVSCDSDNPASPGANADPKTLVVTMPASIYAYGAGGFSVGLFPVGTTPAQAMSITDYIVAGAVNSTPGVSSSGTDPVVLTLPLYLYPDFCIVLYIRLFYL